MSRRQRALCSTCKNVWRVEVGYYEEVDHAIYGCKQPRKAKFSGRAMHQFRCPFYQDIADNAPVSRLSGETDGYWNDEQGEE
jgi:hypothetical protein